MIGPAEQFLGVGIYQLRKKDTVERGVLADENGLFPSDAMSGENVDDCLGYVTGGFSFGNFIPGKTVDAQTLLIALFPSFNGLRNQRLKLFLKFTICQIDNLKCDLQNFMNLRIQSVRFCIEEYTYHSPSPIQGKSVSVLFLKKTCKREMDQRVELVHLLSLHTKQG